MLILLCLTRVAAHHFLTVLFSLLSLPVAINSQVIVQRVKLFNYPHDRDRVMRATVNGSNEIRSDRWAKDWIMIVKTNDLIIAWGCQRTWPSCCGAGGWCPRLPRPWCRPWCPAPCCDASGCSACAAAGPAARSCQESSNRVSTIRFDDETQNLLHSVLCVSVSLGLWEWQFGGHQFMGSCDKSLIILNLYIFGTHVLCDRTLKDC